MTVHHTPLRLAEEIGWSAPSVIRACLRLGVPIYNGRIDIELFKKVVGEDLGPGNWRFRVQFPVDGFPADAGFSHFLDDAVRMLLATPGATDIYDADTGRFLDPIMHSIGEAAIIQYMVEDRARRRREHGRTPPHGDPLLDEFQRAWAEMR